MIFYYLKKRWRIFSYFTICPNRKEQLLFHGTSDNCITSILSTFIDIDKNNSNKIGKGFYMSDLFEVSWRYGKNSYNIPKVGDSFSVLVCNTYYSNNLVEKCYQPIWKPTPAPKNGVRIAKADWSTAVLNEEQLKGYDKFIQTEYLISYKEQMIPMYAINLKRVEYLIIWRDNNFDKSNPNNYNIIDFNKMLEFNENMKTYASRHIRTKIYFVNSSLEGLKLVDRKKYNKIILITNGGDNGRQFIIDARKIIGSNSVALVTCYLPGNHLNWVSQLPNTYISNNKEFFQLFLESVIKEDIFQMTRLKNMMEYIFRGFQFNINVNSLFYFPKFMKNGTFDQLSFIPAYNY